MNRNQLSVLQSSGSEASHISTLLTHTNDYDCLQQRKSDNKSAHTRYLLPRPYGLWQIEMCFRQQDFIDLWISFWRLGN